MASKPPSTATVTPAAPVTTVTCTLCKPHTHQGRELQPGCQIDLHPAQAKWLHGLGVIDAPAIPTDPSTAPVKE